MRYLRLIIAVTLVSSVFSFDAEVSAQTTAQSVATDGTLGDGFNGVSSMSSDGRYIVFESESANLVSGDNNFRSDVFLRDRTAGTTERVSVGDDESQGNSYSYAPVVTDDGRYVAFWSSSDNLVATDNNDKADVFVRDRTLATTVRASVSDGEAEGNGSSYLPSINAASGRYVAFLSNATNLSATNSGGKLQIYRRDLGSGNTITISVNESSVAGNSDALDYRPAMSADGDIIVYVSNASNLVTSDTNKASDIFVRVVSASTTSRVSVNSAAVQGNKASVRPSISADGRYVAFESTATNLVADDTNRVADIFLHDRNTLLTTRISVGPGGVQSNGASTNAKISPDGRFVVYESIADNLASGVPTRSRGDEAPNVFIYDTVSGVTTLASVSSTGELANDFAISPEVSTEGSVVSFQSAASNLVNGIVASLDVVFANVDQCPTDPAKRVPGVCGCGVADEDNDDDGTINCQDACPEDSDKTAVGLCGCGSSDIDDNGNGTADCLDPKLDTVPEAPSLVKKGKKITLTMQLFGDKVEYKWFIVDAKKDKVIKSGKSKTNIVSISELEFKGKVEAYNIVSLAGIDSEPSPNSSSLNIKKIKVSNKRKKSARR